MMFPDNGLQVARIDKHSLVNLLRKVNKPGHRFASLRVHSYLAAAVRTTTFWQQVLLIHHRASRNVQVFSRDRSRLIGGQKDSGSSYIARWNEATKWRISGKLSPRLIQADAFCLRLFANHPFDALSLNSTRRDNIDPYAIRSQFPGQSSGEANERHFAGSVGRTPKQ